MVSKALLDALQRDEAAWTAGALERHVSATTYHDSDVDTEAVLENIRRAILAHERTIEDLETVATLLDSDDHF